MECKKDIDSSSSAEKNTWNNILCKFSNDISNKLETNLYKKAEYKFDYLTSCVDRRNKNCHAFCDIILVDKHGEGHVNIDYKYCHCHSKERSSSFSQWHANIESFVNVSNEAYNSKSQFVLEHKIRKILLSQFKNSEAGFVDTISAESSAADIAKQFDNDLLKMSEDIEDLETRAKIFTSSVSSASVSDGFFSQNSSGLNRLLSLEVEAINYASELRDKKKKLKNIFHFTKEYAATFSYYDMWHDHHVELKRLYASYEYLLNKYDIIRQTRKVVKNAIDAITKKITSRKSYKLHHPSPVLINYLPKNFDPENYKVSNTIDLNNLYNETKNNFYGQKEYSQMFIWSFK